jgi:alpha/beta superfamily hydrolase
LLICNPFGNEGICAHRTVRHLAERAADAGIPTLRFDYAGTGDSSGHDFEPGRLAAWVDSIQQAADELRAAAQVEHVCIAGIRLGAALGALAATHRRDVAGLLAIAPVVSGRTYLRELRMLARAIDSKRNVVRDPREELLETAGFVLGKETQKSLGEIDLKRLETAPAPRVLILDRQDLPTAGDWARHLRERGAQVTEASATGYTEMMLDSHETVVPQQMLGAALDWLGDLTAARGENASPGSDSERQRNQRPASTGSRQTVLSGSHFADPLTGDASPIPIQEIAVQFGEGADLFGIVSLPLGPKRGAASERKAVLMLNSGAVHHVGPNRAYVHVARQLAQLGHVVLRMDLAGIGDSPPRAGHQENVVYSRTALRDVGDALEYLRRDYGATEITAVGLCSGAYHAFKAGVARLPLTGVVAINPLTFFWKENMSLQYPEHRIAADVSRYKTNVLRASSWMKLLKGQVHLLELTKVLALHARALSTKPLVALARILGIRLRDDLPAELRRLRHEGIDLQFVFAANDPGFDILRDQGGGTMRRMRARGQLRLKIIENADHTFTDLTARAMLAKFLVEQLGEPTEAACRMSEAGA